MADFFGSAATPESVAALLVLTVGLIPGLLRGIIDLFGGDDDA